MGAGLLLVRGKFEEGAEQRLAQFGNMYINTDYWSKVVGSRYRSW